MSAVRAPNPAGTILDLGECEVAADVLIANKVGGIVLGMDIRITERATGDFAVIEADTPEELERLAADLVVKAQVLRERMGKKEIPQ